MRPTAIIGPGRVGTALGMALHLAGYPVVAVAGRGQEALERFRRLVPSARELTAVAAARAAELVVVCVPDDALVEVVRDVARDDGVAEGSRWVHVAGGLGIDVLRPAALAGAQVAACHPAQTFPDPAAGLAAMPGTTWAVTAEEADLGWARVLVTDLRGSPVTVTAGNRALYHPGLVVGANATSTVVTLARQLDELATAMPEALDAYVELARLALRHARRAGLDEDAADAIAQVLAGRAGGTGGR